MVRRCFLLFLCAALPLLARDAKEQARIDSLLGSIESLEGAKFIRNGKAHDADEAADHLRKKLDRAGDRVKTAEDFIDGLATKSSFSGKPYRIRFKDGSETATGPWLHGQLKEIDGKG
ncbi:DUF5329 family protein [Haloferula sp. A504]|jgi:hypothetical protein|uniref:DUF5329 family protein n=1 Tax=Haloferula sp. A504 TaxID=3373601 RepID=UPI0031BE62A6|nr:DUF5329 domain-containing protein [Verrucomicrobiaceae bacterium E54]